MLEAIGETDQAATSPLDTVLKRMDQAGQGEALPEFVNLQTAHNRGFFGAALKKVGELRGNGKMQIGQSQYW